MTDQPTLETMDEKMARLIKEWNQANASVDGFHTMVADRNLAEFVAFHPELFRLSTYIPTPNALPDSIIKDLNECPSLIPSLQGIYDEADRGYQALVAIYSLSALTDPIFKDKNDSYRAATNDKEREIALNHALLGNDQIEQAWQKRAASLRNLQTAKNRFEAARLLVQLVCRDSRK